MHLSLTCFVVWQYLAGVVGSILAPSSANAIAYRKLKGVSFDIPEKFRYSYKTLLSGFRRVLKAPLRPAKSFDASTIVFDVADDTETQRAEYLHFYGVQEQMTFVSAGSLLYFTSAADKFFFILLSFPVQAHVLFYGLFKKEKSGLASVLANCLITRNFLAGASGTKKLYMFSIYDTNSAFLSNGAIKKEIHVSQITSEVPLYKWNKEIVTNELILGIAYQQIEAKTFRATMAYDSIVLFGPELYYRIAEQYTQGPKKNNRIGFYSTGGWVRAKLGHIDQGTNMQQYEEKILSDLDAILAERKELELIIYLHPREQSFFATEEELYSHYRKFLPGTDFQINRRSAASNTLFDDVYIAVCYMTTLIFERAHAGRKSVIAYFCEQDFPLEKKTANLEIVESKAELKKLIETYY